VKKLFRFFSVTAVGAVIIILSMRDEQSRPDEAISAKISSKVVASQCNHHQTIMSLTNGKEYRFYTDQSIARRELNLCDFIRSNDSVFKNSNSDTIYVIRDTLVRFWKILK
jgi:hypothetical protein